MFIEIHFLLEETVASDIDVIGNRSGNSLSARGSANR
jgi:hypothetical protein